MIANNEGGGMNPQARNHLENAANYLAQGDEFYRKAKPEIDAAYAAGASLREMSQVLNKSATWCKDVLDWDGEGSLYGSDSSDRQKRAAKLALSDPEQAARIVAELPREVKSEIRHKLEKEADAEQERRDAAGEARSREVHGDAMHEKMREREQLGKVTAEIGRAYSSVQGFLRLGRDVGFDNFSDRDREYSLDMIGWTRDALAMAEAAVGGDEIDWEPFEQLLANEGR